MTVPATAGTGAPDTGAKTPETVIGGDKPAAAAPETKTPPAEGDKKPAAAADATAKPAAAAKTPEDGTAGKVADAPTAPEKYALKLPDGGYFTADDLIRFEALAREHNLTNEQAQDVLEQRADEQADLHAKFLADTKADPTYGGANLAETQRLANAAIDFLRPKGHARRDAFLGLMMRNGAFNHIEVVSVFADLGKRMTEDGHVGGASAAGATEPAAPEDVLYGKPAT